MSEPPALGLGGRYAKTDAGRAEIRQRALPLSRPARNLLLIIDAGRSAGDWLALVKGCGPDELQALLGAGLIALRMSLADALATKGLGSLRLRVADETGFRLPPNDARRLLAEVQRCADVAQMRALAQRFVAQVRDSDGDAAAIDLAQKLLAPD